MWKCTLTFCTEPPEGFRKEQGVPSEHPLPAASEQDHWAVCPHHQHASQEQRPLYTCGLSAPDAHPVASISRCLAAPPILNPRPTVMGPRQRLQTQRTPPVVVGQPLWEETQEAPGREGCKCKGCPPLHDRLGAPAQCPHPGAGGRHPGDEDRAGLVLIWAGGFGGRWPMGRRERTVKGWG